MQTRALVVPSHGCCCTQDERTVLPMFLSEGIPGLYSGDIIQPAFRCSRHADTVGGEAVYGQCVTGGVANYNVKGHLRDGTHDIEGVCKCELGTVMKP